MIGVSFRFSTDAATRVSESAGNVTGLVSVEILDDFVVERELDLLITSLEGSK